MGQIDGFMTFPRHGAKPRPPVGRSAAQKVEKAAPAASSETHGRKPESLDAPRGGQADDLKQIKGVGPKLETVLNGAGIYHFDQVASWTADEVTWVDQSLEGVSGRASRDDWVEQARQLVKGK